MKTPAALLARRGGECARIEALAVAVLPVVADGLGVGVALQVGPGRDGSADFLACALHPRGAVGQPVDVNQLVVLAAVGLAGRDRRRKRDWRVGRDIIAGLVRGDRVIFAVAAG